MRRRIAVAAACLLTSTAIVPIPIIPSAHAFPFGGGIVYDPSNHAQNILTAARTLQQINNQVRQLQNEADMLINDARNLARAGFNPQAEINRILREIDRLLRDARAISYEVEETDRVFQENYPEDYDDWSRSDMAAAAELQWTVSRSAFNDTLLVQSQIVQNVRADTGTLDRLLTETSTAEGALSVAQTGNRLVALGVKQDMQIQELMAAQYRAEALERARRLQIERESRVRHRRFVGDGSAYAGS
ncbi:MAG: P-type conjugative transfer protein TrbJ [Pseudomonadota bacterium]